MDWLMGKQVLCPWKLTGSLFFLTARGLCLMDFIVIIVNNQNYTAAVLEALVKTVQPGGHLGKEVQSQAQREEACRRGEEGVLGARVRQVQDHGLRVQGAGGAAPGDRPQRVAGQQHHDVLPPREPAVQHHLGVLHGGGVPDHGRVQHTVPLVRRAGQEGEVLGPPVRRLRHELRAEAGHRRGRVPHQIRPRVPQLLRGPGEEDLQVPVPRAGAHLLGALQGDPGARAARTLEHALRALHPLRPRVQPARPQRDGGHGRPDGGAVRRGRRGRAGRGGGRTEPRQGEVSPAAPAPRERRRAARVRVCARPDCAHLGLRSSVAGTSGAARPSLPLGSSASAPPPAGP